MWLAAFADRFSAWQALRMAKTMFSVSCGSGITSATSASRASARIPEHSPEQSRITGARVYSRIAEYASSGNSAPRVAWMTASRWPPVRAEAASGTSSVIPTSSMPPWMRRASTISARPSHDPVM